jgi:hypothetical protein
MDALDFTLSLNEPISYLAKYETFDFTYSSNEQTFSLITNDLDPTFYQNKRDYGSYQLTDQYIYSISLLIL